MIEAILQVVNRQPGKDTVADLLEHELPTMYEGAQPTEATREIFKGRWQITDKASSIKTKDDMARVVEEMLSVESGSDLVELSRELITDEIEGDKSRGRMKTWGDWKLESPLVIDLHIEQLRSTLDITDTSTIVGRKVLEEHFDIADPVREGTNGEWVRFRCTPKRNLPPPPEPDASDPDNVGGMGYSMIARFMSTEDSYSVIVPTATVSNGQWPEGQSVLHSIRLQMKTSLHEAGVGGAA